MIRHVFVCFVCAMTSVVYASPLLQHTRLIDVEEEAITVSTLGEPHSLVEAGKDSLEHRAGDKPDATLLRLTPGNNEPNKTDITQLEPAQLEAIVPSSVVPLSVPNALTQPIKEQKLEKVEVESLVQPPKARHFIPVATLTAEPETSDRLKLEGFAESKGHQTDELVVMSVEKQAVANLFTEGQPEGDHLLPVQHDVTWSTWDSMSSVVSEPSRLQINLSQLSSARGDLVRFDKTETDRKDQTTLDHVIRRALMWHPSIRQAQSQILASAENIEAAQAGYYPRISSGINAGYRDSVGRGNESMNISASQMLYDFGKVSSSVQAATQQSQQEQARLLLNIDQLIEKTAFAAFELMRTQEKTYIAKTQMDALTEVWRLAKERSELGASAQSDVIQALSRKEGAAALLWQLEAQNSVWQKELQSLTGERKPYYLSTVLPTELGLQCQNNELFLEQVPMMQIVEAERGAALAQLDFSAAEMYPTLSVDAGYDQYLRSRDNWVDGRLRQRRSDFSVMLNMNVSLYEGGGKTAKRNAARYVLQAVDAEREKVTLEVTRGFEEAQNKHLILSQRLGVLKERVQSIEATQELYKQQYIALGTRSLLDLLNTEQEIYQAKSDYIDNKYEMVKAQVSCLYYGAQLRQAFDVFSVLSES